MNSPAVGIVGCGLIGQKRAKALGPARLLACADLDKERARTLARSHSGALAADSWQEVVHHPEIDIVIVATTNDALVEVAHAAIESRKHVLIEKPGARNSRELESLIEAARRNNVRVRVGFNHRYHPAIRKARELLDQAQLGDLMFVRGRYGHGGRLGYEKEWRANAALSGGGELIDQGVHLIDLSRWFLGDFSDIQGSTHTYFWQMEVDDNAFMMLTTPQKQVAFLHVSCTEWKNLFSLEIYGKNAKLHIEGLGGSYGVERLAFYRMLPAMGPPETTIWEYPMSDVSWDLEFADFLEDIKLGREPAAGLHDGHAALSIVEALYQRTAAATGSTAQ
jgi:predicted dehydrogenase